MNKIAIDGNSLTIDTVVAVAQGKAQVEISTEAIQNVKKSQEYIHQQVREGKIVYGVTTGFGSNADKKISSKDAEELQYNLLISHACGMGKPFSKEITRAIVLIRINTLLAGHSGIRLNTIKLLIQCLNNDILPVIPEQGSVGASGDLAPLSHMAIMLVGVGDVTYKGATYPLEQFYKLPSIQALNEKINAFNTSRNLQSTDFEYQVPIQAINLSHKESLALINGTTVMAALGALSVYRAKELMKGALMSANTFLESLCVREQPFHASVHTLRRHSGQSSIAKKIRKNAKGSQYIGLSPFEIIQHLPNDAIEIADYSPLHQVLNERIALLESSNLEKLQTEINHLREILSITDAQQLLEKENIECLLNTVPRAFCKFLLDNLKAEYRSDWLSWEQLLKVATYKISPQDSYSVRCMPQIFGASQSAIWHIEEVISGELNAVVDNPLIFMEGQTLHNGDVITETAVRSGGNFHGQPLALVLDYMKLAIAEMGNLLERQICKLVDPAHNHGLPAFLSENPGLHSGMMILQYSAASVVSENKVLVHPASADSIPTSNNQEDHVSMGPIAGRQALEIIDNVEKILAYHLITVQQAIQMRQKQFDEKIPVKISSKSRTLLRGLRQLGIEYYNEDKFVYPDLVSVKEGWRALLK